MTTAILYARVSTKGQVEKGFSMGQQIEALREHAAEQGYEVVDEFRDPGYSGSSLNRPGMDALRERVAQSGIGVVLAQDADRLTRDPIHRGILDGECAKHGTRLVALDDWGDDTHEGQLLKFIRGWQAKGERLKTAERVARNKRSKARSGMIVGGHTRAYGFDWAKDENGRIIGYKVNEAEMQLVRRIFAEVASGTDIRTVKEKLDDERVPTPNPKSEAWNRQFIRDRLGSDLYLPHTTDELRQLGVSDSVVAGLDADGLFGVYRYQGISVPVPDAGIPLQVVLAARRRIENNEPTERRHEPSTNAGRSWELSGGILFCSECGRRMQPHTVKRTPGSKGTKTYHYYRCQTTTSGKADRCGMKKHVRADRIEAEVWELVRDVMDQKHYVLDRLEEHYAAKRRELTRPGSDAASLLKRLEEIEGRWTKVKLAYEADALTIADLKARRVELDDERSGVEREIERTKNRGEELRRLDAEEAETRARILAGYGGLDDTTPQKRRRVYEDLHLRVEVGADAAPRIRGVFPIGRYEDVKDHLVLGGSAYIVSSEVSRKETSSGPGAP